MNLSDLIYIRHNVLDKEFCNSIIEKFNADDRKSTGLIGDGYINEDIKKSLDLNISKYDDWSEEDKVFEKSFSDNIKLYIDYLQNFTKSFEDYDINLPSLDFRDRGYLVRVYNKGEGYFNWHNDFSFYKDSGFRLLTLIWYLNNVEEGGQTEFIDGTIIKPKRGSVLIFPTSWYLAHRGKMPLSNKKYIVTGWLHGQKTTSS
tara:strand:+ start:1539 stop:2144 length:606 start_codon:yes stop_codon:yes gene_type:complete